MCRKCHSVYRLPGKALSTLNSVMYRPYRVLGNFRNGYMQLTTLDDSIPVWQGPAVPFSSPFLWRKPSLTFAPIRTGSTDPGRSACPKLGCEIQKEVLRYWQLDPINDWAPSDVNFPLDGGTDPSWKIGCFVSGEKVLTDQKHNMLFLGPVVPPMRWLLEPSEILLIC